MKKNFQGNIRGRFLGKRVNFFWLNFSSKKFLEIFFSKNLESTLTYHWSQSSDEFMLKLKHLQQQREFLEVWPEDFNTFFWNIPDFLTSFFVIVQIVKLCQQHDRYGLLYFEDCTSDYPVKETKIKLAIGNCQVFLLYQIKDAVKNDFSYIFSYFYAFFVW